MNEETGANGRPASPSGRPEPFRGAEFRYYDLRVHIVRAANEPKVWAAHFEEVGAPGEVVWRTEARTSNTVTGAIAKALADCLEAMAAGEVVPRDG